jgi:hypothetical protein
VPFFFRLITDRQLREPRSAGKLHLEVEEGKRRSAEHHRQMAAEAAARANLPRRSRRFLGSADL